MNQKWKSFFGAFLHLVLVNKLFLNVSPFEMKESVHRNVQANKFALFYKITNYIFNRNYEYNLKIKLFLRQFREDLLT